MSLSKSHVYNCARAHTQFDLDHSGRYLVTPSHEHQEAAAAPEPLCKGQADNEEARAGARRGRGVIRVYDLWGQGACLAARITCPTPCVSGVSLHPSMVLEHLNPLPRRLFLPLHPSYRLGHACLQNGFVFLCCHLTRVGVHVHLQACGTQ